VSATAPAGAPRARVSVVMPAYDAERTLAASMRSVLAQTHADVELLVVDDRSRDATWAIAERLAAYDARVVPIRQPRNGGVAAARNAGIEAAQGSHLAFLDSDDRWYPDKLERQLARMRATGAKLSYASYRRVDEGDRALSVVRPPAEIDYAAMLKSNRIGNLTGLYDRSLGDARFRKVGHEDYVFWLEMMRRAGRGVRADDGEPLADYLVRAGSLSSDKLRAAGWQWRIYRDIERLDVARAAWYFAHYAGNAIVKRR
jgi:teichuronic acid biosynthesis glycosyltransferase TuaG